MPPKPCAPDFDKEKFFQCVKKAFAVEEMGGTPYKPQKKGEIGMFLEDTWYQLTINNECYTGDPVEDLDVAI